MFRQIIRKISTINTKPIYSTKEYVDLYINSSKEVTNTFQKGVNREIDMQNKVLFRSVTGLTGAISALAGVIIWSIDNTEKRFEEMKKESKEQSNKVDKRFEHLEKDMNEIKEILKEMNSKK